MKIIHVSDTHLGFSDLDVTDEEGINQRESDFYKAFADVIDAIIEMKPDYVIHTGDLFHRASPSNRAITFALRQLKRLESVKIPFIIIAGNHSTPRTTSSSPILGALQTLDNVHAVFRQHYEPVVFDDVVFHALPHINDERIIPGELDKIEAAVDPAKKNVLMMHCSVGAHYLMHEFGEWVYPKEREALFAKMDYVALGHWHGFGAVGQHPNVYYAGSTERTGSADKRDDKGYVVVELNDGLKVTHHTIPLRKSLSFIIDAERYEEELAALDLSDIEGALVEVRLHNLTAASSVDISNQSITEHFKEALHVKVKREFKAVEGSAIEGEIESVSLEGYFLAHIEEAVSDEAERKRLSEKAKALFASYEEAGE
ncbi:DNA repair exonuclease [Nitratifractor sp.]|uniref:metallophosphoesterase family protein n=1 Tax=Nitratifractor sp. TaxID=2268144 RepID=UPI0025FE38C6|nr:DNA repair exonuclease [Nitratifractor sp.]